MSLIVGCHRDGPNVYCYVHCNPITRFDAWGLETTDESRSAAEDWYNSDDYDGDEYDSFDDYWGANEDSWYDRRASEGYNIFSNDYKDRLRTADADAQKDLFSSSASSAINERVDMLAHNGVYTPERAGTIKGVVNDYYTELSKHHTPAQMRAIAAVLEMERHQGTQSTAQKVSNTWGKTGILQPFNADNGNNSHVNGVDIDWFTDISSINDGNPFVLSGPSYVFGKTIWAVGNFVSGKSLGNPIPFTDPGERKAVLKAGNGKGYDDFLMPSSIRNPRSNTECRP